MRNKNCKNASIIILGLLFLLTSSSAMLSAEITTHRDILNDFDNTKNIKNINNKSISEYHFTLTNFILKGPTAFTEYNGKYHLFYNHTHKKSEKKINAWGHSVSSDLINWKKINSAIAPSENYDNKGLLSGTALENDGMLYLIYTGIFTQDKIEKKEPPTIDLTESINIASSKDGLFFGKSANNPIINLTEKSGKPLFTQNYAKTPYIWKSENDFYALIGSQYNKTQDGTVLLFKSSDLKNWTFVGITALGKNGEMGKIWTNPALLSFEDNDILAISTQGIKPQNNSFLNKEHSGVMLGKLDYQTGKFTQKKAFKLLDYGFDFYSPIFTKTKDGRTLFIATLNDGLNENANKDECSTILTIPRELKIINEEIYTTPAKELNQLRTEKLTQTLNDITKETKTIKISENAYEINSEFDITEAENITITINKALSNEIIIKYDKSTKKITLSRNKANSNEKELREAPLSIENNKLKLNVFADKSSIEIFVNDGLIALSTQIIPLEKETNIEINSNNTIKIEKFDIYQLKSNNNK